MQLSPHFALREFTRSATADRLGIRNVPTLEVVANLTRLAHELEKVRALTGQPLRIHSGYRCDQLNAAVGGHPQSAHREGRAADFDPPAGWTHDGLQHAIAAEPTIAFDIILEEGTARPEAEGGARWLHFAVPRLGTVARHRVRDADVDRLGGSITRVAVG